uniref:Pentacotripeptide-repeat region of PRORP domain-containing protein n=1 Tax=Guillardia theta (strain CCMP2712) TaxID=905079 RepID=A0A0C3THG8_GUITC
MEGLKPDKYTYNAVIGSCAKGGLYEQAVRLIRDMQNEGIEPDEVTYNAVIGSFAKVFIVRETLPHVECRAGKGLQPDVLTYNALITALANGGETDRALQASTHVFTTF